MIIAATVATTNAARTRSTIVSDSLSFLVTFPFYCSFFLFTKFLHLEKGYFILFINCRICSFMF